MKSLKEYSDEIFKFLKEAAPQPTPPQPTPPQPAPSQPTPPSPQPPSNPNLPPVPPAVPTVDWATLSKEIEGFQKTLSRMGFASINDFRQSMQIGTPPIPQPTPPTPPQPAPPTP